MMASFKVRPIFVVLMALLAHLVRPSAGYGRGAPDTACQDMVPRHGPNPQTSVSPFTVTPLQTQVEPGGTITVRIASSTRDTFRGFMMHAISPANSKVALGYFVNPPSNSRVVTCSPGMQNSVTHADGSGKSTLDFTWQAPVDFQGEVNFRCTFVRDYNTYWVQVPAQSPVRVGRSVPGGSAVPPTTYNPSYPSYYGPTGSTPPDTPPPSTTPRIVATSPWSFTTPAPAGNSSPLMPSVYQGCGDTKGCFALYDSACIQQGTCSALVTYALKGTRYEFELWASNAPPNSYVAVGFSADSKMGDDSVTECTLVNGRVNAYMSYNDGKNNIRQTDATRGLSDVEARFTDGNLYCRFVRQSPLTINGKTFDLSGGSEGQQRPYLLLARGPASELSVGYHDSMKAVSSQPVNLAETSSVGTRSATLIKLHGAFMAAAWLFSASLGILFARYFRLTWVGKQIMGKDLWFVFHRLLMVLTWALTLIAFVLIFVELGGWTAVPISRNPHSLIGVIVTVLAFIQPIMAYFRPHPGTPKRFIFNWAHWLVGNSAHILAIVCIFLAVDLDKAAIPYWVNWLLVTWVAIHAFSHLILSLAQCCYHADGSRKSSVMAMRDLAPHQSSSQNSHFYSTQQDKKEDAHGSKFRRIVLALYIVLVVSFSAAVIGTIVTGPWQAN